MQMFEEDEFDEPEFMAGLQDYFDRRHVDASPAPRPCRTWSFDSLDEQLNPQLYWRAFQKGGSKLAEHVEISRTFDQHVRSLQTQGSAYRVRFKDLSAINDLTALVHHALDRLIKSVDNPQPDDRLGVEIRHPELDPIIVPFQRYKDLNSQLITRLFDEVIQSNADIRLDAGLEAKIVHVRAPVGNGKRTYKMDFDAQYARLDGHGCRYIKIKNNDSLCCARAIVTAKAHRDHSSDRDNIDLKRAYETIRKGDVSRGTKQRTEARALHRRAGVPEGPCGIPELRLFQAALPAYRIRVFSKDAFNAVIFDGQPTGQLLNLFLHNSHYDIITSAPAFTETSFFCDVCNKPYQRRDEHAACGHRCSSCYEIGACNEDEWIKCTDCNRSFKSQQCFDHHKNIGAKRARTKSICNTVKRCKMCHELIHIEEGKRHECGKRQCPICKESVDSTHLCHIQQAKEPKDNNSMIIIYDFESSQDTVHTATSYRHQVNLACAIVSCDRCADTDQAECSNCGQREWTFFGDDALDKFCRWLFCKEHKGATAIAHNMGGYDGQFILDYIYSQGHKPTLICRGLSIMKMEAGGIKFLDSLLFLPMSVGAMPKAFGFDEQKGYFPHLFNCRAHYGYVGALPDVSFYSPHQMKPSALKEFHRWHQQQRDVVFNFRQEIEKYCHQDCLVLKQAVFKFRRMITSEFGVDPFAVAVSIASLCMFVFRHKFMPPQSIGIVPFLGYRKDERQSITALKWLKWVNHTTGVDIQHKLNGGEVLIGRFKVDGQSRQDPRVVYEFNGCLWHGCPKCYPNRTVKLPVVEQTAENLYQRTLDRQLFLQQRGYQMTTKWECELKTDLASNPQMADFFKSCDIVDPINPRDGFFGGRTNAIKLHHLCTGTEKIYYVDVCSLYPWVCKYGSFPLGHPTIITEGFGPLEQYSGMIKCRILPPTDLYHPVLPMRVQHKLVFPLCSTCAMALQQAPCDHSDTERALVGTWASCELQKAISTGYRVLQIYEVWHYARWSHGVDGGLFAGYINAWLKKKQEASGWPAWINDDAAKEKYKAQYKCHEGVDLDNVNKNPSMRFMAKLFLNSFWGKFGQRNNMNHTEYFTDPAKYFDVVLNDAHIVSSVRLISDSMVSVTYTSRDEHVDDLPTTSPIIAAWTTAQARLKLYSYLEQLQRRVLYFDTDSVIYLSETGDHLLPLGDYLGDLTNECEGGHIIEFASGGPKQYAYRTNKGDTVLKLRGFTLNSATSRQLNFFTMRQLVKEFIESRQRNVVSVELARIERTAQRAVLTRHSEKAYSIVFDKRRLCDDGSSLPYGFR